MTHLPLPQEWSFRGTDLSTYAYLVSATDGIDDLPPLRGEDVAVPGIPGRRSLGRVLDSRRMVLTIWTWPLNAAGTRDQSTNRNQTRVNTDALFALLANRAEGALVRKMPDGTTRTAQAVCLSAAAIDDKTAQETIGIVADFQLADPFLYGASSATVQAIAASPTALTITNPGSVASERVLFDFTGPISNPKVTNSTNGWYCECLVAVASGKHLLVDTGAWTALNDGLNAIGSIRHSGGLAFFRLNPGANVLSITSTAPGGSLTLTYSPPYI
jgi:hypothetical protein